MEWLFGILTVWHASAIALGVGGSTLAITSFFYAIADKQIDPGERRIMGANYLLLRISMVWIAILTLLIQFLFPDFFGSAVWYMWLLIVVLYCNAILMTIKVMPSKFGPAIQAATWYTLGFIANIHILDLFSITPGNFVLLYAIDIITALVLVNALIWYFNHRTLETTE